jgi:hypothetical protein
MTEPDTTPKTRREFLRDCGRTGVLTGMGLALLALRRSGRIADDAAPDACPRPCIECARRRDCTLPRAVAARQSPYPKHRGRHG